MPTLSSSLDLAGDCYEEYTCKNKVQWLKTASDFKSIHYWKVNIKSFCVIPIT